MKYRSSVIRDPFFSRCCRFLGKTSIHSEGLKRFITFLALGFMTTQVCQAQLGGPPRILTHPGNQIAGRSENVLFKVEVDESLTLLRYQWQFNGVDLPGDTNPFIELDSVENQNEGVYRVVVSNGVGTVVSQGARLRIGTGVGGVIESGHWVESQSPYILLEQVFVGFLEIDPGVQVVVDGDYSLTVNGVLKARGTSEHPIHFQDNGEGVLWKGLHFNSSPVGSELIHCIVEGSSDSGIRIQNSSPLISYTFIRNNSGESGGGINTDSDLRLDHCQIEANHSRLNGGGIYSTANTLVLKDCRIQGNILLQRTFPSQVLGGGIYSEGVLVMEDCLVESNQAGANGTAFGGGLYGKSIELTRCRLVGNSTSGIASSGGGVFSFQDLAIRNCLIVGNRAEPWDRELLGSLFGGGINGISGAIENCTIVNNSPDGIHNFKGSVLNTVFHQNSVNIEAQVSYSLVTGGFDGEGNLDQIPQFEETDFFTLKMDSPGVDEGHPSAVFVDVCFPPSQGTTRNDMGAYGGNGACEALTLPDLGIRLIRIRPGSFLMGSDSGDADELPLRSVTISQGFWAGQFEITQSQFTEVMNRVGDSGGGSSPIGLNLEEFPQEGISWNEAVQFCQKLTEIENRAGRLPEGYVYRLPTEAEWEYLCRAGTQTRYFFGDFISPGQANFNLQIGSATEVGSFPSNAFGLFDLHGNLWEWCYDRYSPVYNSNELIDPSGPDAGFLRVLRGGGYLSDDTELRSSNRIAGNPEVAGLPFPTPLPFGFRLVLAPAIVEQPFFRKNDDSILVQNEHWSIHGAWIPFRGELDGDLFIVNGRNQQNSYFQSLGNGDYQLMETNDLSDLPNNVRGASWGDFDNDGLPDLFLAYGDHQQNRLYRNLGQGKFAFMVESVISLDRGDSNAGAWGDMDNDGDLDLIVANIGNNFLYRNEGQGVFVKLQLSPLTDSGGSGTSASWVDVDLDGDADLYITNTSNERNFLFYNQGDESFVQAFEGTAVTDTGHSQGAAWGDLDNDGDADLIVVNENDQNNHVYVNLGAGNLQRTVIEGVSGSGGISTDTGWGDFNGDGFLDLIIVNSSEQDNLLFFNNGESEFEVAMGEKVNADGGFSIGSIWIDYDRDGDLDVYILNSADQPNFLYENIGSNHHWIDIRLRGHHSNRFGIGARIQVRAGLSGQPLTQVREFSTGDGKGGHSSFNGYFGLGNAVEIDEITVYWPSGIIQTLKEVTVDQFLEIEEPESILPILEHPQSETVSLNDGIVFEVSIHRDIIAHYQWFKDGEMIPGQTEASLILEPIRNEDQGSYRVIVETDEIKVISRAAELNITISHGFDYAAQIGGSGFDQGNSVAIDSNRSVIIGGDFWSDELIFQPQSYQGGLSAEGNANGFIAKYSAGNDLLWSRSLSGLDSEVGVVAVAVDTLDNLYLVGEFSGTVDFDPLEGNQMWTATDQDIYILKLSPIGELLWLQIVGGDGDQFASDCKVDLQGVLLIGGWFESSLIWSASNEIHQVNSVDASDAFVMKLDSSGGVQWTQTFAGDGRDQVTSLDLDESGVVVVSGLFENNLTVDGGDRSLQILSKGAMDGFVVKLAVNSDPIWAKEFGGDGRDEIKGIKIGRSGDLYLLGRFQDSVSFDIGIVQPPVLTSDSAGITAFVAKIDLLGRIVWALPLPADPVFLGLDESDHLYLGGSFSGKIDFDPGPGSFPL